MPSFAKMQDVPGFATDKTHAEWLPLETVDFGVSNSSQVTGTDLAGEVSAETLSLGMGTDASIATLKVKCARAEMIPSVTVEVCAANQKRTVLERYTLTNARVKHVHAGIDDKGNRRSTIELIFDKIKWEIRKPDDTYIEGNWNNVERRVE